MPPKPPFFEGTEKDLPPPPPREQQHVIFIRKHQARISILGVFQERELREMLAISYLVYRRASRFEEEWRISVCALLASKCLCSYSNNIALPKGVRW